MNIQEFSKEILAWNIKNFDRPGRDPDFTSALDLLALTEEVGKVSRAYLKRVQGLRYTPEEAQENLEKELGDVMIVLLTFCKRRNIDIEKVVQRVFDDVSKRNWVDFPINGRDK